ncbi:MAG: hypothetical protein HQL12_07940 [Candidatus Omnitrophica bacterium]|nr:hypothetical protein [Candidatus Omnitrophota bacterium]
MSAKGLDSKVLMTATMGVVEKILANSSNLLPTASSENKEVDIVEYYGHMRAMDMNDFNSSVYIAVVNYYLTQADMQRNKTKGALILYVDMENASKLYKALGFSIPDDEDDGSMLDGCGQLCNLIGEALKNELTNLGYVNLEMSGPQQYKNSVTGGVNFSLDQKKKCQFSFFYWKCKALVVEVTLADIPQKR